MTFFVYSMHSYDVIIYSTERHSVIMPDTLMLEFFVALSEKAERQHGPIDRHVIWYVVFATRGVSL
jgi:hypothetical protein